MFAFFGVGGIDVEEDGVSDIFGKFGMRYDVKISHAQVGSVTDFPYLKPSNYLRTLVKTNDFKRLLGDRSLKEARPLLAQFWKLYQGICPRHDVFTAQHTKGCLDRCLPLYIHGDEGTTYKRKGVLIVTFQAAFGTGGRHAPNVSLKPVMETNDAGIPLNFIRTALQSRFLSVVCPKDCYKFSSPINEKNMCLRVECSDVWFVIN